MLWNLGQINDSLNFDSLEFTSNHLTESSVGFEEPPESMTPRIQPNIEI